MLKAELHGKLSSDAGNADERREDVLTSNVFGSLCYMPPSCGLLPWLERARPLEPGGRELVAPDVTDVEVRFWPRLGSRQADVLLALCSADVIDLVVVECKYGAEKHDLPSDDGSGDQLAAYLKALDEDAWEAQDPLPARTVRSRSLLYVTAEAAMPVAALETSAAQHGGAGRYHWLAWHDLIDLLSAEGEDRFRARLIGDLRELLVRKGLRRFGGFDRVPVLDGIPEAAGWFYDKRVRWLHLGDFPTIPTVTSWFESKKEGGE